MKAATAEERELRREILRLVEQLAPQLLAEPGVGPITLHASTKLKRSTIRSPSI